MKSPRTEARTLATPQNLSISQPSTSTALIIGVGPWAQSKLNLLCYLLHIYLPFPQPI